MRVKFPCVPNSKQTSLKQIVNGYIYHVGIFLYFSHQSKILIIIIDIIEQTYIELSINKLSLHLCLISMLPKSEEIIHFQIMQ